MPNPSKLALAADALTELCKTDEFKDGYAHRHLFVSHSDLTAIAQMLRDMCEVQNDQ